MSKDVLGHEVKVIVRRMQETEVWVDLDGLTTVTEASVLAAARENVYDTRMDQWYIPWGEEEIPSAGKALIATLAKADLQSPGAIEEKKR